MYQFFLMQNLLNRKASKSYL